VSAAALQETLGRKLLTAVRAQHLVALHADSQQAFGGEGLPALSAQRLAQSEAALLRPPVLAGAQ